MQAQKLQAERGQAWYVLIVASIAALLAYSSWVIFGRPGPSQAGVAASLLLIALALLESAAAASLARDASLPPRLHRGWQLLAAATLANAAAETLWLTYTLRGIDPFPSAADFFYLLYYPFFFAGVLFLSTPATDRLDRQVLGLDLGIGLTSSFIVWWYFVLSPQVAVGAGDLSTLLAIAYPIADAVLLTILVTRLELSGHLPLRRLYLLLVLSIAATTVADALFAYYEAGGIVYNSGLLDSVWCLSSLFFILAARTERRLVSADVEPVVSPSGPARRLAWLTFPYVGIVIGAAVLAAAAFRSPAAPPLYLQGVIGGMLILILIVLVRQFLVLRENVELHIRAVQAAITDDLTGLYNRRLFDRLLDQEIRRADRFGHPLSVLLLDMDELKAINDSLGHAAGDEALRALADVLRRELRSVDLVSRLGGDEFAALLPETAPAAASHAVARLQLALGETKVRGRLLRASIGVAGHTTGRTAAQLMEEADRDLYRAKRARREASGK
jgi:diguanylate cyclase (GGDEF)-like protein